MSSDLFDQRFIRNGIEQVRPVNALVFACPIIATRPSIQDAFLEFHEANPHVYVQLVRWARRLKDRGYARCGIGMLFEVLRWQHMMTQDPGSPFKLNNNYRSRYARLLEENEPDLAGFFEKRTLSAP